MTPKEKAEELREKCDGYIGYALVAVDEVLDAIVIINEYDFESLNEYWEEVKQEIEKL